MSDKCKCRECGKWKGTNDQLLVADNPFVNGEKVYGCPNCKSISEFDWCCDHDDCWKVITCGTPTENGYRHTCGDHRPAI